MYLVLFPYLARTPFSCKLSRSPSSKFLQTSLGGKNEWTKAWICLYSWYPREQVRYVKTTLDALGLLDKRYKIRRHLENTRDGELYEVPYYSGDPTLKGSHTIGDSLDPATYHSTALSCRKPSHRQPRSDLCTAIEHALNEVEGFANGAVLASLEQVIGEAPQRYCLYPPMLLLPPDAFSSAFWKQFQKDESRNDIFLKSLAYHMGVTHIAANAPVPYDTLPEDRITSLDKGMMNVLRSPVDLKPLFGNFGPTVPPFPTHNPTSLDFEQTLWVSCCQNNLTQVWAPRYTMFSAGNVTEKARILALPSVAEAVRCGQESEAGSSAVDLFAGIGYFAFSYAKAGVTKVLCWDLNPWSVEGFQRGSAANKWKSNVLVDARTQNDDDILKQKCTDACTSEDRFLIFCESNKNASSRIATMREKLAPIRHINCGMLPTSSLSWQTAVEILDPRLGGWIHVHETVSEAHQRERADTILDKVNRMISSRQDQNGMAVVKSARLEHIERVKSIGPRTVHIVLDIFIPAREQ